MVTPQGDAVNNDDTVDQEMMAASMTRSPSVRFDRLLTEADMNKVQDQFNRECEDQLEDAIRKHNGLVATSIPIYFWVLLFWFASDNIFGWFSSPILFYPMMAILISVLAVIFSGQQDLVLPLVK